MIYDDTHRSADALYFGGVPVPDPFLSFEVRGRRHAVVSALEYGRVRKKSLFNTVHRLEAELAKARKIWPNRKLGPAEVIRHLARRLGQKRFRVAPDFPAGLFQKARKLGLDLTVGEGALFPEREIKSPAETRALRDGNRCSAAGLAAAERTLRASRIKGRSLIYRGRPLTSERLKFEIEVACLEAGGASIDTIAAGGNQACDPHERGSGPLRANDLVIVDIFPRMTATGFWGDMTRTFLRGRASDAQRRLVAAVREGQLLALKNIRAGVNGREVHTKVNDLFVALGFQTRRGRRGSVGFFHGTGHGVGLEIHEPPRISGTVDYRLKKGSVVTVEPGLYYPGIGGCRIEDVVQVTDGRPRMLSAFHYNWELR